jgi:outer membrane protein assembly factor BamA
LKISAYGNAYYYAWFNSLRTKTKAELPLWGEYGGSATLTFPRLLMLPKYQNINFWSYSTEIKFTANYSQLFTRLNLQASYTYRWSPTRYISHSISPVELATLDSRSNRESSYFELYPNSYQHKFDKFFLPSSQYRFNYKMPNKNDRHTFNLNFSFETVGLLLYSINTLINKEVKWAVMKNFNYGTYEKFDVNLTHVRIINKNNAFATHFALGMAIPFKKGTVIPFERSFFVGGANSMRGWSFRQLGPGGFFSKDHIERVGDMRLELNLEYRGPIYKAIKFCVFSDMGNVWLLSKYEDMLNAEFNFSNFYKKIALCAGVGLRLDFNYFLIRLDYGVPLYDPSKPIGNYWFNKSWVTDELWNGLQGIQLGVNYAF